MESNDTESLFLLKIWPAIEANKNRIIGGAIAVILLIFLALFLSWHAGQKEINAGQAFSQLQVSLPPSTSPADQANQFLNIATDYSGTVAGQRAQLQAATDFFTAAHYTDAQTQFQKFVDTYPGSPLISIAALGVASSLDAQGNLSAAADAYNNVIENYGSSASANSAKFALAGIDEKQGKIKDAINYYQEIARSVSGSTLGEQAAQRAVELSTTLPPTLSPATPASAAMGVPVVPLSK